MVNYREYYKGEDGGFPQVWAMVNLVNPCMLVVRLCTKSVPTMLIVWFVQVRVNNCPMANHRKYYKGEDGGFP